jgi:hypothetical protein
VKRSLAFRTGRRSSRREQGSALVLALLFLTVCGVTIGGLLTFANASSNATTALRLTRGTDFDAHAAAQVAIATVRTGASCTPSVYTPAQPLLNNQSARVRVDCYQLSSATGTHAKRNDVFLVCPFSAPEPCDSNPSVPLLQVNLTFYDTPVPGFSVGIQSWTSR